MNHEMKKPARFLEVSDFLLSSGSLLGGHSRGAVSLCSNIGFTRKPLPLLPCEIAIGRTAI